MCVLSIACPLRVLQLLAAISPERVQHKTCSLQMLPLFPDVPSKPPCLRQDQVAKPGCAGSLYGNAAAWPFPNQRAVSEDEENSASGLLSNFCVPLPLPSWSVSLEALVWTRNQSQTSNQFLNISDQFLTVLVLLLQITGFTSDEAGLGEQGRRKRGCC